MQFNVHALDAQQQVIALSLEAGSEADARGMAEGRGLTVFSIEGKRQALGMPRVRRGAAFKTSLFSIELLSLLEAGLNLLEALQTLPGKNPPGERPQGLGGPLAPIYPRGPVSKTGAPLPPPFL